MVEVDVGDVSPFCASSLLPGGLTSQKSESDARDSSLCFSPASTRASSVFPVSPEWEREGVSARVRGVLGWMGTYPRTGGTA